MKRRLLRFILLMGPLLTACQNGAPSSNGTTADEGTIPLSDGTTAGITDPIDDATTEPVMANPFTYTETTLNAFDSLSIHGRYILTSLIRITCIDA